MKILRKTFTLFFFNLEKRNFTSKVIHKLMNKESKEVTETSDVLKCQTIFYKKNYIRQSE